MTGKLPIPVIEGDPYWPFEKDEVYTIGDRHGLDPEGPASGSFHQQRAVVASVEHGPRYCYIEEIDFMYLFDMNFGLDTFGHFTKQVSRVE